MGSLDFTPKAKGNSATHKAIESALYIREYCEHIKDCRRCPFDYGDCFCRLNQDIPKNWRI